MTDLIYEQFAKNYLKDLLSPYVQVELDRVVARREEPKEEDPYRQFAKSFLSAALSPYGTVEVDKELPPPEPLKIPVYCVPTGDTVTDELGLLKRFLEKKALFHAYFNEIEEFDIHDCLSVILTSFQEYNSKDEKYTVEYENFLKENPDYLDQFKDEDENEEDQEDEEDEDYYLEQEADAIWIKDTWIREKYYPFSWVFVPTISESLIDGFGAELSSDWLEGIYFTPPAFRMGIVVIDELPKTYETLWLRLVTKGKVLLEAIDELEALRASNVLRFKALNALMTLRTDLERERLVDTLDEDDEDLLARLDVIYKQLMN